LLSQADELAAHFKKFPVIIASDIKRLLLPPSLLNRNLLLLNSVALKTTLREKIHSL